MRPDWSFVLIGPDHDGSLARSRLAGLPNVHALGPRPYATLPGYLHRFDVATIPFAINDITLATSPLKLFEYFAAGRPVISTPMPECAAFDEVRIVRTAEEFSAALDAARRDAGHPGPRARFDRARCEQHLAGTGACDDAGACGEARNGRGWSNRPVRIGEGAAPTVVSAGTSALRRHAATKAPAPKGEEDEAGSPLVVSVMRRFDGLKTPHNRNFFHALAVHLAASHDDPCLPMYFEFALSANERGRKAANLIESIVPLAGKRTLDVGCACGGFLVALAECGAEPTGFDIDEALLALAEHNFRDVGRRYPVHRADVTNPADIAAFHDTFDVISCNDVIEHVRDPAVTIAHIASMLRRSGVAYFEIPNRDAVSAVMADGHYQLFGITQLDRETAQRYYGAHAPGVPYGVEHYLRLDEYRKLFDAAGLSMELVPDPAAGHAPDAIRSALDELREALPERLAQVPLVVRDEVERAVLQYLDEAARRSWVTRAALPTVTGATSGGSWRASTSASRARSLRAAPRRAPATTAACRKAARRSGSGGRPIARVRTSLSKMSGIAIERHELREPIQRRPVRARDRLPERDVLVELDRIDGARELVDAERKQQRVRAGRGACASRRCSTGGSMRMPARSDSSPRVGRVRSAVSIRRDALRRERAQRIDIEPARDRAEVQELERTLREAVATKRRRGTPARPSRWVR